jgi:hypothetical protein
MQRSFTHSGIPDQRVTMSLDPDAFFTTLPSNINNVNFGHQYHQGQMHPASSYIIQQTLNPMVFDTTEAYHTLDGYLSPASFSQASSLAPCPELVDDLSAPAMSRNSSTSSSISTSTALSVDELDMANQQWMLFDGLGRPYLPDFQVSNSGPYIMSPNSDPGEVTFDLPTKYPPSLRHLNSEPMTPLTVDQTLQRFQNNFNHPKKQVNIAPPPSQAGHSRLRQSSTRKASSAPASQPISSRQSAARMKKSNQPLSLPSTSRAITKPKLALPPRLQPNTSRKAHSSKSKIICDTCGKRFRGPHELDRHQQNKHSPRRISYICVDGSGARGVAPSMLKVPLDDCRNCQKKKQYGAYYNAAAQ